MFDDVEADFWKEVFVHMQHKNMVRTNSTYIYRQDCEKIFNQFKNKFPDIDAEIVYSSGYATWEVFITQTIKLRLFIQLQVKASLLQINNGDLVKIVDAKFPYNPFPEIEELFTNKDKLQKELNDRLEYNKKFQKQQKITGEIIKAILKNKFKDKKIIWNLEPTKTDYKLTLQLDTEQKIIEISFKNFMSDINNIEY